MTRKNVETSLPLLASRVDERSHADTRDQRGERKADGPLDGVPGHGAIITKATLAAGFEIADVIPGGASRGDVLNIWTRRITPTTSPLLFPGMEANRP